MTVQWVILTKRAGRHRRGAREVGPCKMGPTEVDPSAHTAVGRPSPGSRQASGELPARLPAPSVVGPQVLSRLPH